VNVHNSEVTLSGAVENRAQRRRAELAAEQVSGVNHHTLIEELERLLEAARAGEIVGMAGTYVHRDKTVSYSDAGAIASYGMLGGLDCVKERLLRIAFSKD
jgi:hypothetical protein